MRDHEVCQCFWVYHPTLFFLNLIYACIMIVGKVYQNSCNCMHIWLTRPHLQEWKMHIDDNRHKWAWWGTLLCAQLGCTCRFMKGVQLLRDTQLHVLPTTRPSLLCTRLCAWEWSIKVCESHCFYKNHILSYDSCDLDVVVLLMKLLIQIEYWIICLG